MHRNILYVIKHFGNTNSFLQDFYKSKPFKLKKIIILFVYKIYSQI